MEHVQPDATKSRKSKAERLSIREIIVVEGIHDKQAVERVADADIWVLGGDRVAHRMVTELKRAARTRGVIVLTDPDGPGERIRRRLEVALPNCKHAFVQKADSLGRGAVGVEHASDAAIVAALTNARPVMEVLGSDRQEFSMADLTMAGLAGGPEAAMRRQLVGDALSIGYGNAKAFLHKLNALGVNREEWEHALSKLDL